MSNYRDKEQIEQTMGFHPGHADVANIYAELRERFRDLATHVIEVCSERTCPVRRTVDWEKTGE